MYSRTTSFPVSECGHCHGTAWVECGGCGRWYCGPCSRARTGGAGGCSYCHPVPERPAAADAEGGRS